MELHIASFHTEGCEALGDVAWLTTASNAQFNGDVAVSHMWPTATSPLNCTLLKLFGGLKAENVDSGINPLLSVCVRSCLVCLCARLLSIAQPLDGMCVYVTVGDQATCF